MKIGVYPRSYVEKLEKTLRFYAGNESYMNDRGTKARRALAHKEEPKEIVFCPFCSETIVDNL